MNTKKPNLNLYLIFSSRQFAEDYDEVRDSLYPCFARLMTSTLVWLIAGIFLCAAELVLPTTFIVFNMGLAAILVAIASTILPFPNLLIALWVLFSLSGVMLSRRFLIGKPTAKDLGDDREGETLTTIMPGQTGRVLYEGNSWRAKCADENAKIGEREAVYIVEKKGNTLIVLPLKLLS